MHIFGRAVRLLKLAAFQLFAVLLLSALFQITLHAQVEGLRVTAGLNLTPSIVDGRPALTGNYQLTCNIQDEKTTYGFGEMKLFYAITEGDPDGDVEVRGLSGLLVGSMGGGTVREGPLEVTGPLGGSRVRARLSGAFCHHEQLNSELVTVWTESILIPPQISVIAAFDPEHPNNAPYVSMMSPIKITDVPDVPMGKKLVVMLDINAHPQKTESIVLRFQKAGVSYTQEIHDIQKEYNPMKTVVIPTLDGEVNVWVEFRPNEVKSNVLQFHAVPAPKSP